MTKSIEPQSLINMVIEGEKHDIKLTTVSVPYGDFNEWERVLKAADDWQLNMLKGITIIRHFPETAKFEQHKRDVGLLIDFCNSEAFRHTRPEVPMTLIFNHFGLDYETYRKEQEYLANTPVDKDKRAMTVEAD